VHVSLEKAEKSEDAAIQAAKALKDWEKASEYMKLHAVGVLVKDDKSQDREHKLGKREWPSASPSAWSRRSPGAASPWSEGFLVGAAGGGVIGEFLPQGLKMRDEDTARIARELDAGHAAVGVLTWDSDTDTVAEKLKGLGRTPQNDQVAEVTAEAC
jgi:hypothetical protein